MGGRKRKRRGDGEHEEKAADPPATPERDNWRQALFGDVKAADGLFNCRLCSYVPRGRRGRRDNRRAPQERHAANLGAALAGLFSGVGLSAADVHEYDTDMLDELEALVCPVRLRIFFRHHGKAAPITVDKVEVLNNDDANDAD